MDDNIYVLKLTLSSAQERWFLDWINVILQKEDVPKIVDVMIYYDESFTASYTSNKLSLQQEQAQRLWRVSGSFEIDNARTYMRNAWMCDGVTMGVAGKSTTAPLRLGQLIISLRKCYVREDYTYSSLHIQIEECLSTDSEHIGRAQTPDRSISVAEKGD
ncbi:hypothetical protein BDV97DRAFT_399905 [Delphinella strobiligena]|nr:hypothetical protein BDV97DRAFT_399905 [Delphinella strobiligena]